MRRLPATLVQLGLGLLLAIIAPRVGWTGDGALDPFGFTDADFSSWGIVDAAYPYDPAAAGRPNAQGCFPVGNGLVFATLGVDGDFNTLTNLTGPGYQTRDDTGGALYWQPGDWPDMRIEARWMFGFPANFKGGVPFIEGLTEPLAVESQSIQQLRGAAMVRTVQVTPHGTLHGLAYAVPGEPVIIREFAFVHREMPQLVPLKFELADAELDGVDLWLSQGTNDLTIKPSSAIVGGHTILELGQAEGELITRYAFALIMSKSGEDEAAVELTPAEVARLRQQTYQWWREWSSHNLSFATGDQRLDDLMAQLPVIIETQRDAAFGGVSPMVSYHGYWVRDSLGPIYAYLLNGRFDEVMRMLTYHRKACWQLGSCSMLVPLDLDVSGVQEPVGLLPGGAGVPGGAGGSALDSDPAASDGRPTDTWDAIPVEHAEVPSLIVLEHYWLWSAMRAAGQGDAADAFIREAWPFITHNLFAMQFDPTYGVHFHGDETYTNGALYSTYDREESGKIGYPNGYIPTEYYSFDNTLLHNAAANAVASMAAVLGDTTAKQNATSLRDQLAQIMPYQYYAMKANVGLIYIPALAPGTFQPWPWPFSNISLAPLWPNLPYSADLPVFESYLDACLQLSIGPYPWTTPASGYMTGHALGYWLNAQLAYEARDHSEPPAPRWNSAELARMLLQTATPEGAWCEVLSPAGLPVEIYGRVNRIRPWESGMNYAALVRYCHEMERGTFAEQTPLATETYPTPVVSGVSLSDIDVQVLAITIDAEGSLSRMRRDSRLESVLHSHVEFWDAGLPFTHNDLYHALMFEQDGIDYIIPYLYIDQGVQDGLDRRTFKDEEFWQGAEMQELLKDYQAASGTVITEDTIKADLAEDQVVKLRLLIVLYPRTFTWEMDAEAIADFHKEIAKWVLWYDKVAGEKLRLDLDFLQIDRRLPPLNCGPQGDNVYWMSFPDVEPDLRARGVPDGYYDSVCCFWAWDRDAASLPDGAQAAQAYGGAAIGPGDDVAFLGPAGRTSYYGAAVLKSRFVTTGRVALHEYLHNLDAMFAMAGMDGEFYSSDEMEEHMAEMLAESPGCYAAVGYTDEQMRDLAAKSARGEADLPWRTQLIYYRWMLERTPKSDFARLLLRYGSRDQRQSRTELYGSFLLPEGETPYQVAFDAASGLAPITIEDVDLEDGYVHWRSSAYGGPLTDSGSTLVRSYREAELIVPDRIEINLANGTPALQAEVRTMPGGALLDEAQVSAEIEGQLVALLGQGGGSYLTGLPEGLPSKDQVVFKAYKEGWVISPCPVELQVSPGWQLGYAITQQPGTNNWGISLKVTGPPGDYLTKLKLESESSTVRDLLYDSGLLKRRYIESTLQLKPGSEAWIGSMVDPKSLAAAPATVMITRTAPDGAVTSFTHVIPPALTLGQELGPLTPEQVPDWMVKAVPLTPVLDGDLSEWPVKPSLAVTPEGGHVFNGRFTKPGDGSTQLWLAYDADNLYVAGRVADDQIKRGGLWDSDRLNLVFDARLDSHRSSYPDGAVGQAGWQADDWWVLLCPFAQGANGAEGVTERLGGEIPSGGKNGYFGEVAGARMKVVEEPGGYRFEWALPLTSLPYLKPAPKALAGFTFFLTDHDQDMAELMYLTDWSGPGGIEWRFWDCGLVYFEP